MFTLLQTVGTAALPYLLQAGKDIAKGIINQTLSSQAQGSMQRTLGDCAQKVIDTVGNKLDMSSPVKRGRQMSNALRGQTRSSQKPQMIIRDQQYQNNQYSVPPPRRSISSNVNRSKKRAYQDQFQQEY